MKTPTERQAQFLAYIYHYSIMHNNSAPAEADMQRFFDITPPSVHSMVLLLEKKGYITRIPGVARSIRLNVAPESLPMLKSVEKKKRTTYSASDIESILAMHKLKAIFEGKATGTGKNKP